MNIKIMFNYCILIVLLVSVCTPIKGAYYNQVESENPTERLNEWKQLYTLKTFEDRESDLLEVSQNHYPNDFQYTPGFDDHFQVHYAIMGDVILGWEKATGLPFNRIFMEDRPLPDSVFGKSELTQMPVNDQQCIADLYIRSSLAKHENRCRSDNVIWWRMYAKFARCVSDEFRGTPIGEFIVDQIVKHIDLCDNDYEVYYEEYDLKDLKDLVSQKSAGISDDKFWYEDEDERYVSKVVKDYSNESVGRPANDVQSAVQVKPDLPSFQSSTKHESPVQKLEDVPSKIEVKKQKWKPNLFRSCFGRSCK